MRYSIQLMQEILRECILCICNYEECKYNSKKSFRDNNSVYHLYRWHRWTADSMKRNLICIYEVMANKGCENLHVVLLLVSKEKMTLQAQENLRNSFENAIPNVELVTYTNEVINKK